MKKILNKKAYLIISIVILLFTIVPNTKGQNLPYNEKGKIAYSDIIYLDSIFTKKQIYSLVREWFAVKFNDSKSVIQMDDENLGKIIGKGVYVGDLRLFDPSTYYIDYTISVYIKEARYKYVITDFTHSSPASQFNGGALEDEKPDCGSGIFGIGKKSWKEIKTETNEYTIKVIDDLNKFITENSIESNNDDW